MYFSEIESNVFSAAYEIMKNQPEAPKSPCSVDQAGKVSLCAAACLAAAGLEIAWSKMQRQDFERQLAVTRSSSLVEAVFTELGWSVRDCADVLGLNDKTVASDRRDVILALFEQNSGEVSPAVPAS